MLKLQSFDTVPMPVAVRSTVEVCGRSIAGIAGSNLDSGMDVLTHVYCVSSGRGFCDGVITHPGKTYRVCMSVCSSSAIPLYTYSGTGRKG